DEKLKEDIVTQSRFLIEDYKNHAHLANIKKLEQQEANNSIKTLNLIISITLLVLCASLIGIYIGYNSKKRLNDKLKVRNEELQLSKDDALKATELKSK